MDFCLFIQKIFYVARRIFYVPSTILSTGESAVKKMNKGPVFMALPFQIDRVGWGKPQTKKRKGRWQLVL